MVRTIRPRQLFAPLCVRTIDEASGAILTAMFLVVPRNDEDDELYAVIMDENQKKEDEAVSHGIDVTVAVEKKVVDYSYGWKDDGGRLPSLGFKKPGQPRRQKPPKTGAAAAEQWAEKRPLATQVSAFNDKLTVRSTGPARTARLGPVFSLRIPIRVTWPQFGPTLCHLRPPRRPSTGVARRGRRTSLTTSRPVAHGLALPPDSRHTLYTLYYIVYIVYNRTV